MQERAKTLGIRQFLQAPPELGPFSPLDGFSNGLDVEAVMVVIMVMGPMSPMRMIMIVVVMLNSMSMGHFSSFWVSEAGSSPAHSLS
jgi:hypothetical protein